MFEALAFYLTSLLTVLSTGMALTRSNAAHALVYLVVALLSTAVLFYLLGAPFAAALQVLIYAGAIMVLFVYVVMMLNLGSAGEARERAWLSSVTWRLPAILCALLLLELMLLPSIPESDTAARLGPKAVAVTLFGPYVLAVELASMLLLAALVSAYHLARRFHSSPFAAADRTGEGERHS